MNIYGLIGKKLTHSFSAEYFNRKFKDENIEAEYKLFELENIRQLPALLEAHPEIRGFNVTIPYKEQILPYLNDKDEIVREIGACNCVKIIDGKLYGYNTDVEGFMLSIVDMLDIHHHSALVLGNGGASKAVVYALEQWSIESLVVARHPANEQELPWNELTEEIVNQHKILINTTPVGMWPKVDEYPDIPYEGIDRFHLVYDLIYNPETTKFLQKADERYATIKNGMEMLEQQAEAAWKIWNKREN